MLRCFLAGSTAVGRIIRKIGIKENTDNEIINEIFINGGIYTSVKGMPTGISISVPGTYSQQRWDNLFILIDYPRLTFDIGRKDLPGRQKSMIREVSKKVFNSIEYYFGRYGASVRMPSGAGSGLRKTISNLQSLPDLSDIGISNINYQKIPNHQEAAIAAIFFESIGRGHIKSIYPIGTGYRQQYDLYALEDDEPVVFEFKSELKQVIKDFSGEVKFFDELDYIVCWEVKDDDIREINEGSMSLDEHNPTEFDSEDKSHLGVTHRLSLPNSKIVYVIDLKRHLQSLSQQ